MSRLGLRRRDCVPQVQHGKVPFPSAHDCVVEEDGTEASR